MLRGVGKRLSAEALAALERHPFPGNIRELRNFLDRAVLLTDGAIIGVEHLPLHVRDARPTAAPEGDWPWGDALLPLEEVERRYLRWASQLHDGDRRSLADRLGLSERTLYRKLRTIRAPDDER
jgi:DNA-binding NtrC family response regulator